MRGLGCLVQRPDMSSCRAMTTTQPLKRLTIRPAELMPASIWAGGGRLGWGRQAGAACRFADQLETPRRQVSLVWSSLDNCKCTTWHIISVLQALHLSAHVVVEWKRAS